MRNKKFEDITTLIQLNNELLHLDPSISGIDLSMLQAKGANLAMLDAVIAADNTQLYDKMKRADVLNALKGALTAKVNSHPIEYSYDVHGDKHFPGGAQGTKFSQNKQAVNPELEKLIKAELGRIRRDANGKVQTYYLTTNSQPYSKNLPVCIQVDYVPGPPEKITYHGYPDDGIRVFALSRTKGGPAIAK